MTTATQKPFAANESVAHLANGMTLRSGCRLNRWSAGDYVRLCLADGSERSRWDSFQWAVDPVGVMAAIVKAAANDEASKLVDKEVVVRLADGSSLRSGVYEARRGGPAAGEYARIVEANGQEYLYWDSSEWLDDPELVMGAIINTAAGLRLKRA